MTKLRWLFHYGALCLSIVLTAAAPLSGKAQDCADLFRPDAIGTTSSDPSVSLAQGIIWLQRQTLREDASVEELNEFALQVQAEREALGERLKSRFPNGWDEANSLLTTPARRTDSPQLAAFAIRSFAENRELRRLNQLVRERIIFAQSRAFLLNYVSGLKSQGVFPRASRSRYEVTSSLRNGARTGERAETGAGLEAAVATHVEQSWGDIISLNEKTPTGRPGDLRSYETDIKMGRGFIEVTSLKEGKTKQILGNYFSKAVNPRQLPVILFAPNYHPVDAIHLLKVAQASQKPIAFVRTYHELDLILSILYN